MRWLTLAILLVCQPAWGWFLDGGTLYRVCTSGDRVDAAGCEGFIIGIFDGADTTGANLCPPAQRSASEIVDVAIAYLEAHPEHHDRAAASIVRYALLTAFSCT
jgi:hypothetical protein